ncbi:hypothetical protein [Methylobacter sp.]|nr:hypothetical protein [Methylobacter sp.]
MKPLKNGEQASPKAPILVSANYSIVASGQAELALPLYGEQLS